MACSGNLGPKERRKRWVQAAAAGATAAVLAAICVGPCGWTRAAVVTLCTLGAFCALQAAAGTCAILAIRGLRNLDRGVEAVADFDQRHTLKRRAHEIFARTALVFTLACASAWLL